MFVHAVLQAGTMSEASAALSKRITVMVVDDEPAVRRLSRRMLERAGYDVHEAADPRAALAMLAELGRVDVVVSDLQMPMDGEALATQLASQSPRIPIVFISASGLLHAEVAAFGPLLTKPFTGAQLTETVRQVLARPAQDLSSESSRDLR
jgi:CheY-like chemotaxis protein